MASKKYCYFQSHKKQIKIVCIFIPHYSTIQKKTDVLDFYLGFLVNTEYRKSKKKREKFQ